MPLAELAEHLIGFKEKRACARVHTDALLFCDLNNEPIDGSDVAERRRIHSFTFAECHDSVLVHGKEVVPAPRGHNDIIAIDDEHFIRRDDWSTQECLTDPKFVVMHWHDDEIRRLDHCTRVRNVLWSREQEDVCVGWELIYDPLHHWLSVDVDEMLGSIEAESSSVAACRNDDAMRGDRRRAYW